MKHSQLTNTKILAFFLLLGLGCSDPTIQFEIEPSSDDEQDGEDSDDSSRDKEGSSTSSTESSVDDTETASAVDTEGGDDSESEVATQTDPPPPWLDEEEGIGSPCSCTGDCAIIGSPVPTRGQEQGCDGVPAENFPNAKLACLRSFTGNGMSPKPYFYANGYCTLYASKCVAILDPINLLCPNTTVGNYEKFNRCPEGTALVSSVLRLEGGPSGTLIKGDVYFKICAPLCETDADCRINEIDPIFSGAISEYQCIEKDDVKFCLDPRALNNPPHDPDDYTAEAF